MREVKYLIFILCLFMEETFAQKMIPFRLPDTGQDTSYTATLEEDADFIINPMAFKDNGDGTITDYITGLMWQKTDGGEMTFESAANYCQTLSLGGYSDWRLPTNHELFSINKFSANNPALNTTYFTITSAEYWWTSDRRSDDTMYVWVVNAGGGIGAHLKNETISAGGARRFHVRAVRNPYSTTFAVNHFTDRGDETIKDNFTGLIWQKNSSVSPVTWEEALTNASSVSLAGRTDWRVPNIKELQSLIDVKLFKPVFDRTYFPNSTSGKYWSSTTQFQKNPINAWTMNIDSGIASYHNKTMKLSVLYVRGGMDNSDFGLNEVLIPAGTDSMGDHFNFVDPKHPSDELPVHLVKIDSFYITKTETTNEQFLAFLNASLLERQIEVRNNIVYAIGGNDVYCYTHQYASYCSIGYDGRVFSIVDFRAYHPVVGVMWYSAAAYCNWLSRQNGLQECYNLSTWVCDFTKNGYRLPTEAEWEYAGRGGQYNPYYNYPWGNDQDVTKANWPGSNDPYEGVDSTTYPFTTPVGFYNGELRIKSEYNWPGTASSYQTSDGANAYGLYDMAGNVWEFVNDWYGQDYYSISPYDNPKGPDSTFKMPDGKPYRGMRGGNWYNGYTTTSVNDGHSRVSNRNPSYYRGPQDPNHPWYHIGFRIVRKYDGSVTGIIENKHNIPQEFILSQNYPNPFNPSTTIEFSIRNYCYTSLRIYDILGREVALLVDESKPAGNYSISFDASKLASGIYFYKLTAGRFSQVRKMIFIK